MLNNLNKDWKIHLKEELDKDYFLNLMTRVTQEYSNYTCFPPLENIFAMYHAAGVTLEMIQDRASDLRHSKPQNIQ